MGGWCGSEGGRGTRRLSCPSPRNRLGRRCDREPKDTLRVSDALRARPRSAVWLQPTPRLARVAAGRTGIARQSRATHAAGRRQSSDDQGRRSFPARLSPEASAKKSGVGGSHHATRCSHPREARVEALFARLPRAQVILVHPRPVLRASHIVSTGLLVLVSGGGCGDGRAVATGWPVRGSSCPSRPGRTGRGPEAAGRARRKALAGVDDSYRVISLWRFSSEQRAWKIVGRVCSPSEIVPARFNLAGLAFPRKPTPGPPRLNRQQLDLGSTCSNCLFKPRLLTAQPQHTQLPINLNVYTRSTDLALDSLARHVRRAQSVLAPNIHPALTRARAGRLTRAANRTERINS